MSNIPGPVTFMLIGAVLGLMPFVLMLCTSFLKVAVVLALVRNATGVQQIPPSMALNGLAIILTLFIMLPVVSDTWDIMQRHGFSERSTEMDAVELVEMASASSVPLKEFLQRNNNPAVSSALEHAARRIWPERFHRLANTDNWALLILSFAISEISRAFELGFLLYLPFICIDLVVSNILLAMGMMMVSPMTISLPFKLLLFVYLDGWAKIFHGLMLSYR
ncbi:MAG: type III secretion system export apparatus subunit SctR [Deltaproteobacteria bacterium]|jgi:type III secretion protein R|nr:type III secretion system export apparatus subunit SctR [Deltaproteobacteria bacterium]